MLCRHVFGICLSPSFGSCVLEFTVVPFLRLYTNTPVSRNPASHVAYPRGVAEKSLDTREDFNQRNEMSPVLSGIRLAGRMGQAASPPSELDVS